MDFLTPEPERQGVVVGIDIGQRRDPTALCVAEIERRHLGPDRSALHYLVRHLDRLPLGTPYPEIAARLENVVRQVEGRSGEPPLVYIDATGVGQPVVDTLRGSLSWRHLVATYFTHGDRRTWQDGDLRLGKAYLVSRLQVLLQTGRVHLPRTSEAAALAAELQDYEIRVDENANDRYGAFRVGTHDDLVTALGLAVQHEPPEEWRPFLI